MAKISRRRKKKTPSTESTLATPHVPDKSLAFSLIADFLDLPALAALVNVLGPRGRGTPEVDAMIERALVRANRAPLCSPGACRCPAARDYMDRFYGEIFDYYPTMPPFRPQCATPLLSARAIVQRSDLFAEPSLPEALKGLYAHGEAYGTKWGAELESSVLASLPDARAGRKGRRTLVIVSTMFENGEGPQIGNAWHEWTIVEARLSDDATGAFTTLVAFQRAGFNEWGGYDPWCAPCDAAYAEAFAEACGVAVGEVGHVVQFLSRLSWCGRTPAWAKLEMRYKRSREELDPDEMSDAHRRAEMARHGIDPDDFDAVGHLRDALAEERYGNIYGNNPHSADGPLPGPGEPTAAGDFPDIAFGRAPVDGEAPNGITDTRDSYHLDRTTAPRRRLVALCGALPASARRALGPCVVALRDACARCTYEMPFPEHWNEESNDEY